MYSYGLPHMAEQKQDDQQEHTYSSYVKIRDVAQKTCQRQWTIGKSDERGSGISMLATQHDDDDDDENHITVNKLFVLDRNTWNYIRVCKLLVLDRNDWNHKTMYKLFVFDLNSWNHITPHKLFVLDRNTWNQITACKSFVLDRNTWNHIRLCKLFLLGWLVGWLGFYGISIFVRYLIPNPLYTYIFNIYDL